ncbi:DUF2231 domain-containing protein [Geomesophilobacter sediminis]|uniref:DUF2231 domain-containing protein n=1 Tax=Geomesophilobacter sediminis TaxID=2798584 RepID=A0A8J7LWC4_9BACT|nr:DUF2231 domain-containing protein [Geomesophilobacter sediminis]MBJ6725560.1 DUF2231 domain-containing protein [Geomesophilobacter sediminis]
MISKVSVARHPIHPMLVPLPIGLWVFSLVCDFIFRGTGNPLWSIVAFISIGGGVIGALLAALPGLIDLYTLPPSRAKTIGLWHMAINLALVTAYVLNFLWRRNVGPVPMGPVILSVCSVVILAVSGWLGGEMVYVHGVGVAPVEAPTAETAAEERGIFGLRLHHRH